MAKQDKDNKPSQPAEPKQEKYLIGDFVKNLGSRSFRFGGKMYKADALTDAQIKELAENPDFKHITKQ